MTDNLEAVRPCEKCGHADVHRKFRKEGERWRVEYEFRSAFAYREHYMATASREHIEHTCRCCGYEWQTKPLPKPRKPRKAKPTEPTP